MYLNTEIIQEALNNLNYAYPLFNSAEQAYDNAKSILSSMGYSTKNLDINLNIREIQEQTYALIQSLGKSTSEIEGSELESKLSVILSNYDFNFNNGNDVYLYETNYQCTELKNVLVNANGAATFENNLGSGNVTVAYYPDSKKIGIRYNQGSQTTWNKTKVDGVSMHEAGCGIISIAGVLSSVLSNQNGYITYVTPTDLAKELANYSRVNGGAGLTEYVTNSYGLIGDYDKLGRAISEIYGVSVVVNQKGGLDYNNYENITSSNTGIVYSEAKHSHINAVFSTKGEGKVYECDTSSGKVGNLTYGTNYDTSKRALYISSQESFNVQNGKLVVNGEEVNYDIGNVQEIIVGGKTYTLEKKGTNYIVKETIQSNTEYLNNLNKEQIDTQEKINLDQDKISNLKTTYETILESQKGQVATKNDPLNLRSTPAGTGSAIIKQLEKNSEIYVTSEEIEKDGKTWVKVIDSTGTSGYVDKQYVTVENETINKTDNNINNITSNNSLSNQDNSNVVNINKEPEITSTKAYVNVTSGNLNVRTDPNGEIISKLPDNAEIEIVGEINQESGWTKVLIDDKVAYVASKYLSYDKPEIKVSNIVLPDLNNEENLTIIDQKTTNNNPNTDPFNQPIVVDTKLTTNQETSQTLGIITAPVSANFRSQADVNSAVIGYLNAFEKITILDDSFISEDGVDFIKVMNSKGQIGYVAKKYVDEIL